MTNSELADLLTTRPWDIKVSLTKGDWFVTVDGTPHIISEDQAVIIWDLLPQVAALVRPTDSSLPKDSKP